MYIQFLGAAGEVTGSKYFIEGKACGIHHRFLIDYGMFQGGRDAVNKNLAELPIPPEQLDFVVLTHAHIDHSGLLPRLCSQGFKGDIYCTPATEALLKIMLLDSAHLQESALERAEKRRRLGRWKGDLPQLLYNTKLAIDCLSQIKTHPCGQPFEPASGVRVEFRNAGHILGAAIVLLEIEKIPGEFQRIVFSGDLGMFDQPFTCDPELIEHADVLIVESTYGDRLHRTLQETENELVEVIATTMRNGGNVVMPAFAVGRTQEIILLLTDLVRKKRLPHLKVWVDSPMAAAVTRLTEEFYAELDEIAQSSYDWQKKNKDAIQLRLVADVEESKALNKVSGGAIILSASGMCEAGRILFHLAENLPHKKNAIVITGFQAQGTLGRRLVEGAKTVKILGNEVAVDASVHTIGGLSAHADQANLIKWLKGFKSAPQKTFVVHGEAGTTEHFAQVIEDTLGWEHVLVPHPGVIFPL